MTNSKTGLTAQEVENRRNQGLENRTKAQETKSIKQILHDNLWTFFNIINFILGGLILLTGSFQNMLFLGVIVSNILIGIFQELRAKIALDKIRLVTKSQVKVVREGKLITIHPEELVLDDLMYLEAGNQIVVDGLVVDGQMEVNESLLTGESDPILKKHNDPVLSGSYVMSSFAYVQVTQVGENTYASQLGKDARRFKKHPSQLRDTLNMILKVVSFFIVPVGILMAGKSLLINHNPLSITILETSASLIGMIPEGLFLLCSVSLSVGVVKLITKKTLVQEMFCIESMARIDTLCLDKTGTITEGKMHVKQIISLHDEPFDSRMATILKALNENNFTALALKEHFHTCDDREVLELIPFSSVRKYSGARFDDGLYRFGSYPHIVEKPDSNLTAQIEQLAEEGLRVLTLVKTTNHTDIPLALFCLEDPIRKDAAKIFDYFKQQGITIKVISGDHPATVSRIAQQAGVPCGEAVIDMSHCISDSQIEQAVCQYSVFGRVQPQQKKAMIEALQRQGHNVAMMGDGINDVPAMKESDCSIAVNSGSDVAKNVANLLLLDSDFSALPLALLEGRRVINNIQRTSSLFLTKTVYSIILAFLVIITPISYPFVPIQLSFVSSFTIGIPGFFLAIEPSKQRVQGNFLLNVAKIAVPAGISVIACILFATFSPALFPNDDAFSTFCLITICVNGLRVLYEVSCPLDGRKILILLLSLAGLFIGLFVFPDFLLIPSFAIHTLLIWCLLAIFIQILVVAVIRKIMLWIKWE